MELFKLEPGLAIWTWISFGILFFIFARFVIPNVLKNLKERENYIHSAVDKTAEIEERLKEINAERAAIIKKAEQEADEILIKVRKEAEILRDGLIQKAETEAAEIIELGREKAEQERLAVLQGVEDELADFVCSASEQMVGFSFVSEKDREFTRELVKKL